MSDDLLTEDDVEWLNCAVNLITSMHHPDTVEGGVEAFAAMRHALTRLANTAEEIERLEARVKDFETAAQGRSLTDLAYEPGEVAHLTECFHDQKAEIERLQAALEQSITPVEGGQDQMSDEPTKVCDECDGKGLDSEHHGARPMLDNDCIRCPIHGDVGWNWKHAWCASCGGSGTTPPQGGLMRDPATSEWRWHHELPDGWIWVMAPGDGPRGPANE